MSDIIDAFVCKLYQVVAPCTAFCVEVTDKMVSEMNSEPQKTL